MGAAGRGPLGVDFASNKGGPLLVGILNNVGVINDNPADLLQLITEGVQVVRAHRDIAAETSGNHVGGFGRTKQRARDDVGRAERLMRDHTFAAGARSACGTITNVVFPAVVTLLQTVATKIAGAWGAKTTELGVGVLELGWALETLSLTKHRGGFLRRHHRVHRNSTKHAQATTEVDPLVERKRTLGKTTNLRKAVVHKGQVPHLNQCVELKRGTRQSPRFNLVAHRNIQTATIHEKLKAEGSRHRHEHGAAIFGGDNRAAGGGIMAAGGGKHHPERVVIRSK